MQLVNERRKSKAWAFPELEPVPGVATFLPGRALRPEERARHRRAPAAEADIRATTITFRELTRHGDLLVNFLETRKRVFIDQLHWNVPQVDGMEFDQYDTPQARWIAIHNHGQILAGVRLTPTTAKVGIYSYMLRDAQKGLLDGIPPDILFLDAPVDESVWEASRLFVTDDVSAHIRHDVQSALMSQMSIAAREVGATHVIGIVPALFSRWLRRLGLDAVPVGRRFEIDGTRSQAALFNVSRMAH